MCTGTQDGLRAHLRSALWACARTVHTNVSGPPAELMSSAKQQEEAAARGQNGLHAV